MRRPRARAWARSAMKNSWPRATRPSTGSSFDEWNAIALNYTSGTTGNPKGVVTHHRGAYLNAASNALAWNPPDGAVYLWTLPMFHCNGWCLWTTALMACTSVCLRRVDPVAIFSTAQRTVTHLCGADRVQPADAAPAALREGIGHTVQGLVAPRRRPRSSKAARRPASPSPTSTD